MSCIRIVTRSLVILICCLITQNVRAQITQITDATSTPASGVGHDYIHLLSETVNPANGSVSLGMQMPTPKGRGITIPFAFAYNSNGVHHIVQDVAGGVGAFWRSNTNSFASGGWSYSYPSLSADQWEVQVCVVTGYNGNGPICTYYPCDYQSNYVFEDAAGGTHALGVGAVWSANPPPGACNGASTPGWGDSQVFAQLPYTPPTPTTPSSTAPGPVTVYDASGTIYYFPSLPGGGFPTSSTISGAPTYIEDRNGNKITATQNGNNGIAYIDTLGRTVISVSGFGPSGATNSVSVGGLTYKVTWKTISANFSVPSPVNIPVSGSSCVWPSNVSDSEMVVSQISLPNGQAYKFYYGTDNPNGFSNPYGLLSEIDYPDGGWVRYTWQLGNQNGETNEFTVYPGQANGGPPNSPVQDGCLYQYQTPVVATRSVGFGGSSTPALTQSFTYSTSWSTTGNSINPAGTSWVTKSTSMTATDNVVGKSALTKFSYGPISLPNAPFNYSNFVAQVPVESSVQYFDWGNTTTALRTVNKTWFNQFTLTSQQTILDNNQSLKVTYCYAGSNCLPPDGIHFPQLIERDEYDFGASSPTRKTLTNYENFTTSLGSIANAPCQTIIEDANSNKIAETDYLYDNGTSVCGTPGTPSVTPVSGLSTTTHDETNFSASSTKSRGNVTTVTRLCLQSCSNATVSYTYDETGQVLSKKDACGNASCSDMSGSNHITSYSWSDSYDTPPNSNTNAYLTKLTNPLGQSSSFKYAYSDGQLIQSTDVNKLTTQYYYNDPLRRLTETDLPDGGQTLLSYNDTPPTPSITTSTKINSSVTLVRTSVMDGFGHVTHTKVTSDPQGSVFTDTTYNGLGLVYTVSNPYRSCSSDPTSSCGTTTYQYDALSRPKSVTYPDNSVLTTAYCGPSTLVTDPTKRWRRTRTDALGHLVEVDEPNSPTASVNSTGCPGSSEPIWVTSYTLDVLNNLTNVVQNGSHQRSFSYDSLSRLLTSKNPEVGTITYTYDPNSNVSKKQDARSITTRYTYDVLNREISRSYSNGDPTVTTAYDGSACLGFSPCQNIGHRTSMTDAAGSETWAYQVDKTNFRSIHVDQRTTTSGSNNISKTGTYYFDLAGNLTQAVYPTGRTVNYTYDAANRPSTAVDGSNGITYATGWQSGVPNGCVSTAACYTPQGSLYAAAIGQTSSFGGLNMTNIYNTRLQPGEFKASSTTGNAIDISYSYADPVKGGNAGNVASITNNLNSSRTQSFSYDQVNRIVSAGTFATTGTYCWGYQYSYDGAWGNLVSQAGWTPQYNGCSETTLTGVSADGNNHLSILGYDASGNVTRDGSVAYTWNGESQLTSGNGVTYTYDGAGRRVAKVGSKLYWYGPANEVLAETDSSGNLINEYVFFGGRRVALLAWK